MPTPAIPKFRVPLQLQNGRLALVEQDSEDNVAACVYAILAYERGSRLEDPNFGVDDPSFETVPVDTDEWLEQIAAYEPRAQVQTTEEILELTETVREEVGVAS